MLLPQLLRRDKNEKRVILACMPKSGSTFLSTLISQFPGMRREHLVPGYKRREQEICLKALDNAIYNLKYQKFLRSKKIIDTPDAPRGFISQMHLRHTETTQQIAEEYDIKMIVLVRNIFDAMVSLADHIRDSSYNFGMAYADEDHATWDDERLHRFLVDMAAPWYMSFFVAWTKAGVAPILHYEDLSQDPGNVLRQAAEHIGLPAHKQAIQDVLSKATGMETRKNKAVAGRGDAIPEEARAQIHRMASYYKGVDFSSIGL